MQKSGRVIDSFDLNQDGVVTMEEMEEAVKRSFSNVKHDVLELKKVQEHGLQELNRFRKDLDEFVHRDDFAASGQQVSDFVRLLEKNLHDKENKLLRHITILEKRLSMLTNLVMEGTELKSRLTKVEQVAKNFEGVMDLSHLNRKLHDEILRLSSDIISLKHSVKDDLHNKVEKLEGRLSGGNQKHIFITRAELDEVADGLKKQQSAHISKMEQQLSIFKGHFSTVEKTLKKRELVEADLGTLREHLSAAEEFLKLEKEALAAKDEFRKLNDTVRKVERQMRLEIRKEVAEEVAKHDEKFLPEILGLKESLDALRTEVGKLELPLLRMIEAEGLIAPETKVEKKPVLKKRAKKRAARRKLAEGKVAKVGIRKKPGFLYYVDKQGDISASRMARGRKKNVKKELKQPAGRVKPKRAVKRAAKTGRRTRAKKTKK